jgi:hypothetical protein
VADCALLGAAASKKDAGGLARTEFSDRFGESVFNSKDVIRVAERVARVCLEAAPGFEPGIRALQAPALPLGYAASAFRSGKPCAIPVAGDRGHRMYQRRQRESISPSHRFHVIQSKFRTGN